ncbi:MAG: DUF1501 domain-containing protein [Acidobacteria bacterium]|nr:DUF1501 domain-containing protein [Acidobacteriota bacterium]MCA1610914.1 DUF1501 domain-containing protein [Acidobacteriota bacterium]MCA1617343.1 DUF1501 domain-containing protein [Acidobacteriota bacterium]
MPLNRREFLFRGVGVATVSAMIPKFAVAGARFFEEYVSSANSGRVLVVVELAGGNDGLNTVVPYTDALYSGTYRKTIGVPASAALDLDGTLGLNPVMTGMKSLWDGGRLAVIEGVSYPSPNLSHFTSRDIWHTADPKLAERRGWLGRYADKALVGTGNPLSGCAISSSLPRTLLADNVVFPAFSNLAAYSYATDGSNPGDASNQVAAFVAQNSIEHEIANRSETIEDVSRDAASSSATLKQVAVGYTARATYPNNSLGQALKLCAEIIVGNLGTSILYVTYGGFDNHSAQKAPHDALLLGVSGAIKAFFDDLDGQGKSSSVLLMTWSEFGRRVQENGSLGTDHGTAGVHFVVGPSAVKGIYGPPPQLSKLDNNGNLPWQTDFRSYYGTILTDWLGVPDVASVLGAGYPNLGCVALR